jgi:hypothetical protein
MDGRTLKWISGESQDCGWIHLLLGSCEHGNEPLGSIYARNFLSGLVTIRFSIRSLIHSVSYGLFYDTVSQVIWRRMVR